MVVSSEGSEQKPFWKGQEEIVISGISGRFPKSENVKEFGENLYSHEDMITEDEMRWKPGFYDLPKRHGKIRELKKFDAAFFGVTPKQANFMDPQLRILLESVYEAMIDSGLNPTEMRGTNTGVFVGASGSETGEFFTKDPETVTGYSLPGCIRAMFSNRISFAFDLHGPSFTVDTACSSSMLALNLALDAIRQGQCDAAVVAGSHLALTPTGALQFLRLGMLSDAGACKSFDESGDGYVRTEGIAAIIIQKSSTARRSYATIVHAKSNTDGFKEQGITFPSGQRQAALLRSLYQEAEVDPNSVSYVETHGTGTKVGDPQEVNSICDVFCSNRPIDQPLLIGSVKSNMGHAEPASGLCSIAKVLLSIENGNIPANLHFKNPNPNIPGLLDGRLKVIDQNTPFNGGYIGINSFGFGGSNTHILLKTNSHNGEVKHVDTKIPRLVLYPGRTEEGIEATFDCVEENRHNEHLLGLLSKQIHIQAKDAPYRGFLLLNEKEDGVSLKNIQKIPTTENRPIWFVYSGMGCQWAGMGQGLMKIPIIDKSLRECSKYLEEYGLDVYGMLKKDDPSLYQNNTLNCMLGITSIQVAITDFLFSIGVDPSGFVGHSIGEVGCSYADGTITKEQTMKLSYMRGSTIMNSKVPVKGAMAAVALSWEDAKKRCPPGVLPACNNGAQSVTISGEADKVNQMVKELTDEGIFAKAVDSSGIPFHSPMLEFLRETMLAAFKTAIPKGKERSSKWISTSIPEDKWNSDLAKTASAEYHCNNVLSPVLFYEGLKKIPENAIVIEIAPNAFLQAILKRNLGTTITNIGINSSRAENELEFFMQAIGKIYQAGGSLTLESLYPQVTFPVPNGTPMLGPLWKWDHTLDWTVIDGTQFASSGNGQVPATASYNIDAFSQDSTEKWILDHTIDGRALYPFTGHLCLAWRTLCKLKGVDYQTTPVVFENVNVYKATILSKAIRLDVVIVPGNGNFEILDGDQVCAAGRIYIPEDTEAAYYEDANDIELSGNDKVELDAGDCYKEFLLRGYEYGPNFQGVYKFSNSGEKGTLHWTGNWVTFLDALLQTSLLIERSDSLRLPTRIRHIRIDPNLHLKYVTERDGLPVIEVINDLSTNGCIAGGVEVVDMISQAVPRRPQTSGQLFLEKVMFIKHFDDHALDGFEKDTKDLLGYKNVLKNALIKGIENWKKEGYLQKSSNKEIFEKVLSHLKSSKQELSGGLEHYHEEINKYGLLNVIEESFKMNNEKSLNFLKAIYKSLDGDKLWVCGLNHDRLFKVLQDIVFENTPGHKSKCLLLDLASTEVLKHTVNAMSSHPLIEVNWNVAGSGINELDEASLQQMDIKTHNVSFDGEGNLGDLKNFDYIILNKVLNRKNNLESYLNNCKKVLRPDGFIIINEFTQDYELIATVEALNGREFDSKNKERHYGAFFDHQQLLEIFKKNGFVLCNYQSDPALVNTLYCIRKVPEEKLNPTFVNIDDIKEFKWIDELKEKIDERQNLDDTNTIWLVSDKVKNNGTVGMGLCFNEENSTSNKFRTFCDISTDSSSKSKISLDNEEGKNILSLNLHANNYRNGSWGSMRHLVVKDEEMHSKKKCSYAFINTLVRGDVSSLTWVESPNQFFKYSSNKNPSNEECAVYYSAINFRDIMLAYGRLSPDAIPGNFADRECLLGMEYSGRLENGKRIMGILPAQAMATSVIADKDYAWEVPETWSLADAATVPVVFATAYYALVVRGKIQAGEQILIHGGSGGVGQAAIAIALAHGLEVFTTVGNEKKKQFLKERFPQLKDRHFANSRKVDFETYIRRQTKGKGVELVLNSLAGEMLQASVRCLAQHGRFLEIGKVDLSQNTALGMAVFLKNASFHGILLDAIMDASVGNKHEWKQVKVLLEEGIKSGVVQPLPYTEFGAEKVEDSFRFMSAGKHIGKVLIKIREEEKQRITKPLPIQVDAIVRTLCDPTHSYLITGGLGGFGLELAQWLVTRGAKNIILTSRSGIKTGYQHRCVNHWKKRGVNVEISTLNISNEGDAESLIKQCNQLGPLSGVFHLAMVLRDCLFENQSVKNFQDSAEAKYHGTINLDKAVRKLTGKDSLRWFVVFSSISSGRGNAGQTNYGWSNCTMERIIEQRRADGHPGLAVQWGAIGDVGVILESMGGNDTVIGGTLPQRMPSCLSTFDLFLGWDHGIVSSYLKAETEAKKSSGGGDLLQTIAHILGVNDASQLNQDANLGDLGLDSLMGVEIKQALERDFDIVLSMKDIRGLTFNKLAQLAENCGEVNDLQKHCNDMEHTATEELEKLTVNELENQMKEVFKLRIDVNDLEPTETLVHANNLTQGSKVFFVHSVEGITAPLMKVMAACEYPAYCFQFTKDVPTDSIESVAKYYVSEMKKVQPKGPYRIVGYSYGAAVAFEMAKILQEVDGQDSVERLILLDGSHHYLRTYSLIIRKAFGITGETLYNNPLFESEVICMLALRFTNIDYQKFRTELLPLKNFKDRIQKLINNLPEGLFKSTETLEFACNAMYHKLAMAGTYIPKTKFDGHITLIRAEQGASFHKAIGDDYGISEVSKESKVLIVPGNHDSFVQGDSYTTTAGHINTLIKESLKN